MVNIPECFLYCSVSQKKNKLKSIAMSPFPLILCSPGGHGHHLLGDTHGVLALAHEGFPVVVSLGSDRDELKRVGSGAELPVDWLHLLTGAAGQVEAPDGILTKERRHKEVKPGQKSAQKICARVANTKSMDVVLFTHV